MKQISLANTGFAAVIGTTANVDHGHGLMHRVETLVSGYLGSAKRPEATDVDWRVVMRTGRGRALNKQTKLGALLDKGEKLKASVRAKVAHPLRVITCQFGFTKVRYKGAGQEDGATHYAVCLEQSVDGAPTTDGSAGMSAPAIRAGARQQPVRAANWGNTTRKPARTYFSFHFVTFHH